MLPPFFIVELGASEGATEWYVVLSMWFAGRIGSSCCMS